MIVAVLAGALLASSPSPEPAFDAMDSCFVIQAGDSLGTGFLIEGNLVVTAAHVVGDEGRVVLETGQTSPRSLRGDVVYRDEVTDLAIIRPTTDVGVAELALASDLPSIGDLVYAVGSPIGQLVASRGMVLDLGPDGIESTTPVDPGSSGGPLLGENGAVLGVVIEESEFSGHSFSVPAEDVSLAVISLGEGTAPPPVQATAPIAASRQTWLPFLVVMTLIIAVLALALSMVVWAQARRRERGRIVVILEEE